MPGDIPLLVELLQEHAPAVPKSEYEDVFKGLVNKYRRSLYLDVFRELLEERGWDRGAGKDIYIYLILGIIL